MTPPAHPGTRVHRDRGGLLVMPAWLIAAALAVPLTAAAQSGPVPRSLGPILATSTVTFGAVSDLVALSDGRVLVSDLQRRVMVLLDSSLSNPRVVLDSVVGRDNSYAVGFLPPDAPLSTENLPGMLAATNSFLAPFRGDSSVWHNVAQGVFTIIEPDGRRGRALAVPPRSGGLWAAFRDRYSVAGALVYTDSDRRRSNPDPATTVWVDDSLVVLRWNYDARTVDTIGRIHPGTGTRFVSSGTGVSALAGAPQLFPFHDGLTVTSDGTIAIFRAREYRIEWITPGGGRLEGARLTYPWRRITDSDRKRIVDSVNASRMRVFDSLVAKRAADSAATGAPPTRTVTSVLGGVSTTREVVIAAPSPPRLATAADVPDFYPPTRSSPILADAENRVWLRPIALEPEPGFVIWDVISRTEGVVDRIRIPESKTIAGFGAGGHVFLVSRDAGAAILEKVRVPKPESF